MSWPQPQKPIGLVQHDLMHEALQNKLAHFSDARFCQNGHEYHTYTMAKPVTMLCMGVIVTAAGTTVMDCFSKRGTSSSHVACLIMHGQKGTAEAVGCNGDHAHCGYCEAVFGPTVVTQPHSHTSGCCCHHHLQAAAACMTAALTAADELYAYTANLGFQE